MFRSASFRSRLSAVAHLPLLKTQFLKTCCAAVLLAASSQAGAVDLLVSNFTDSPDPATRGGQLVYSATITNNEADSASNATLTFALDPETTFVSVSDAGHCAYQSGAHQVSCSYPTIKGDLSGPGSADVITVNVTVASKASAGATVSASATVASVDADSNSANNALSQLTTLDNGADLALALGVSPPSVPAGASIAYTLGATNNGPNVAGATSVALTLSPNLTYQSASGSGWSCAVAAQVVTCTRASAALGALPDITVNAKVTGATTGTITSAAAVSISGSAVDYDSTNNSATANLTVSVGTDLALSKGASSNTPAAGAPMSFTLAPRNTGPFAATGVTVTDNLPAGFAVTSASGAGWSCAINGQAVTCTTASYAVGATDDITIGATAPAAVSATNYTNTAQIASATPDANAANDVASKSVTVLPDGIDLAITKTKGPNPVAEGAPVQSTIAVTNNGPQGARAGEVAVTDTLPAGETYTSYSGANWTCGAAGQVVTCTYNAALANGAKTSNLVITSSASAAGTLTNNACATYTDSVGSLVDPVGGNNCTGASVIATTAAGSIDLQLAKSVSVDPLVWNASTLSYTLTLTNAGPAGATGITLRDPIPGAVSGTGIVASQTGGSTSATFSCTNASTVVCTQTGGAALEPGETAVFTIDVSRPLKDSGAGKFTNTATVSSNAQGDTNTSNNSASVQVKVEPVADLTVSSSVTPTSAQAGTKATYVLTVNNSGPSNAAAVALTQVFTLAGGTMTFLSATPSSGSCSWDGATQALSCTLGALAASGTATVTVDVRPDYMSVPPTPRNLVADVSVASSTNETNLANNAAQTVLSITQASVDLLVNNTDSPDPLGYVPASANPTFPDNVVTFKNTVTNKGPSVASNVTLTYTMTPPAGKTITFLGDKLASTGQAYSNYCDHLNAQATAASPLTISCTLPGILAAANATTDLYLDFRVDTQPSASGDTFTSSVTVASSEPESLSVNNSVTQTTTVRMRADLQLAKSARAYIGGSDSATTTAQVRQPFYWVLTLTNAGPGDSQVTTITDTLPAGVALYTPAGGAPSPYNAAPYNAGVAWSTNNGTPTSG
ncbi:MAG: CARDB domain-containing protein, partial [Gammaproteobacteria bacterium]